MRPIGSAPLVTVITPAYDAQRYLPEAIRSVLAQKFKNFEYLIVDDGSRDATARIARRHAGSDPRIRVITFRRNRGLSQARNAGIKAAKGRYIAFLDADDIWMPGFLSRTVAVMEKKKDLGVVFTWAKKFTSKKGPRVPYRPRAGYHGFYDLSVHICAPGNGSSLLIRKECFREVGLFLPRFRVGMDAEMWLRISLRSSYGSFYCLPRFLLLRRLHPASLTSEGFGKERERARTYILETYLKELPEGEQVSVLRAQLDSAMRHGAKRSKWLDSWITGNRPAEELLAHLDPLLRRGARCPEWLDHWVLQARKRYGPEFFSFSARRSL